MHSEKVPYFILDLLQQVPSVYVPGLGRFDAIFHPAVIDLPQAKIRPPYIQPDFIPHVDSEGDILPYYMHYVSGIEIDEARQDISLFVKDVMLHLKEDHTYSIDKFGVFSLSESEVLHFTPDWDAFNLSFSGLEVIDLNPQEEPKTVPVYTPTPPIAPVVAIPVPELVEEKIEPVDLSADKTLDDSHEEIIQPVQPGISDATTRLAWVILTSALILITVLCAYLAWDIISDRQRMNQLSQVYPDTLGVTNEFDVPVKKDTINVHHENPPVTNPEVKPDTVKVPPVQEETTTPCYVIVGAFGNPDNVTKMVQRLEGMGYKSAQIKGGTLTKVAISTSCDKETLEKILNEARSGINPESWIY